VKTPHLFTFLEAGRYHNQSSQKHTTSRSQAMSATAQHLLSQSELARRWGRSESVISLTTAVGSGPRYVKVDGVIRYSVDEIQRYERACLFFEPAEFARQALN
jgi:hypothetical protein